MSDAAKDAPETVTTTVRLSRSLYDLLKAQAAYEARTLSSLMTSAFRRRVGLEEPEAGRPPLVPVATPLEPDVRPLVSAQGRVGDLQARTAPSRPRSCDRRLPAGTYCPDCRAPHGERK